MELVLTEVLWEVEEMLVDTDELVELVDSEVEVLALVELVEVVVASADALTSTVSVAQPELVPPTEVVCKDQDDTPPLVS